MRKLPALGLITVMTIALAGCATEGGGNQTPEPSVTTSASASPQAKVYSEDELRDLISGMKDDDGNELKLYSQDQVEQGSNVADLLLSTATVDPEECKSIATAGLMDSVDSGDVAVAISDSDQPRTLSAQSGSDGPDAVEILNEISGAMDQCDTFSVEALGRSYEVTSEELDADTDAETTFATLSTRADDNEELMQVSAAEGRLLVVATKSGTGLGDSDQKELEELIDEVLDKADGDDDTSSSPTSSRTSSPSRSASATSTASESDDDDSDDDDSAMPSASASR